jgi:hypothetical protein
MAPTSDASKFPAEFSFFLFDLRANVFRQLGDDVLLLRLGQPEFYGMQVAIQKFPGVSLLLRKFPSAMQ